MGLTGICFGVNLYLSHHVLYDLMRVCVRVYVCVSFESNYKIILLNFNYFINFVILKT
jgi:hypothetical protein